MKKDSPVSKPNFTGTWTFNPGKSVLQVPIPESAVFVIEQNESSFRLDRTHVFDGKSDTLSLALTTDGAPVVMNRDGLEIHSTVHWEGDTLVFISTFPGYDDTASNTVRYRLGNADQTLTAEERLRSSQFNYDNIWVSDRE
jgi:hypothetical protein